MFVAFEGGEGSGKTTVMHLVEQYLTAWGFDVLATREPGGTEVGREIRKVVLGRDLDPVTQLLLMCADRNEHVREVIKPALNAGKLVLSDRYSASSIVYQGLVAGVDGKLLNEVLTAVMHDIRPNLYVFLDVEPAVGLARKHPDDVTVFEKKNLAFHEHVQAAYRWVADENARWLILDATTQTPERLAEIIGIRIRKVVRPA